MTKIQHQEEMEEQEEYFKAEIYMLESIISQLGNIRNNKEIKLQLEVVQLRKKVAELKSFNSKIVSWSSAIRQHNADLRSQLAYFKSGRRIESVLRERSLLIQMI